MVVANKRKWLPEVDVLKGLAILMVVYVHLDSFLYNYNFVYNTQTFVVVIGLGLFFFISGYILSYNNRFKDRSDVIIFYKKRLFRIYPLYWLSLISIIVVFGLLQVTPGVSFQYDLSIPNLAVNFLGLQSVIPGHEIPPLWFIGDILLCYLLYPIAIRFSNDIKGMILILLGMGIVCILLNNFFGLIRSGFIWNFAIFTVGAILYESRFLSTIKNLYFCIFPFTVAVILFISYNVLKISYVFNILTFAGQLVIIPIAYWITKSHLVKHEILTSTFLKISYGAYAIYLFHIQIFSIVKELMSGLSITGISFDILFCVVVIPLTISLCYLIQIYFTRLLQMLKTNLPRRGLKNRV